MERYCGIIKPKARSKSQLNTSLANAIIIAEHLNHTQFTRTALLATTGTQLSFPVLLDRFSPYLTELQQRSLQLHLYRDIPDRIEGYRRCQLRQDLLIGSLYSQRQSDLNRRDYRVCFRRPNYHTEFGEIHHFIRLLYFGDWAWIQEIKGIDIDKQKGVASYGRVASHRWIQIQWIQSLVGVIEESGVKLIVTDIDLFE